MKYGVISVIVPVYLVEKYLSECIESIINQTYKELEVILVDDGSKDQCGIICDRYAQMDRRIAVLHQKNGGAAAARNSGLRIATGQYIAFVDGDDYLEPEAYEKMLGALLEYEGDIVQSNFRMIYIDGNIMHNRDEDICCFSALQSLGNFPRDWAYALCTNKLFKREVLENVFFEEGHLIDDEFFTYLAVMNARKVVVIPTITYNYRQRESSIMKNSTLAERKTFDIMDYLKTRMERVIAIFPELKSLYEGDYVDSLLRLAESDWATEKTVRKIKNQLLSFVNNGKIRFWKRGQRKYALRILSFLLKRTGKILENRKAGKVDHGYTLFE